MKCDILNLSGLDITVIRTTDLKPDQINSHLFISRLSSSVYLATTFAMDQYIMVSLSRTATDVLLRHKFIKHISFEF